MSFADAGFNTYLVLPELGGTEGSDMFTAINELLVDLHVAISTAATKEVDRQNAEVAHDAFDFSEP